MLRIRMQKENTQIAPTKRNILLEKPIERSATEKITNEIRSGKRLSKRDTSQPEIGRPIKELMGIANSKFPSSASFKSNCVLIVGIREAHVEKQIPERKKYILNEIRCFCLASIVQIRSGKYQC